jgi:hypothetical protein
MCYSAFQTCTKRVLPLEFVAEPTGDISGELRV